MAEQNDARVDVDEIMAEIRAEIKSRGLQEDTPAFSEIPLKTKAYAESADFDLISLQQSATYLQTAGQIDAQKPLVGNPISVFVKKVLRKLLQFYIVPIVTEQNRLNQHCANVAAQTANYIAHTQALTNKITRLEQEQAANRAEIAALHQKLDALSPSDRT